MPRIYSNYQGGEIEVAVDTTGGGSFTLSSAGLASLPVVASPNTMMLTLDPDGINGNPETVMVTAHASTDVTATFTAAQEGSLGRPHDVDEYWTHGWLASDAKGSLLGLVYYTLTTDTSIPIATSTMTDADATNLAVTFIAPPSGKVLVTLTANANSSASDYYWWGVREGATNLADVNGNVKGSTNATTSTTNTPFSFYISGLTPGSSHTYKWAHGVNSGTGSLIGGPTRGPFVMKVEGVNL